VQLTKSVSMFDPLKLQLLDKIGRVIQNGGTYFGGIHVVFCGDFLQLRAPLAETFAFECDLWRQSIVKTCLVWSTFC
jgi:hypothetical protein